MSVPTEPLPPPAGHGVPAGWYSDPFEVNGWRWWDGQNWTGYEHHRRSKPVLPSMLSWPVVVAAPLVLIGVVISVVLAPLYVVAAVVPAVIVIPVLKWLDRIEPEPLASRVHAFLWGGTVAVLIAVIVNVAVGAIFNLTVAAVVSAPIIEEFAKGLGVVWAVRRREVDSMSDGVIYAGFVAIGFAVVEDIEYFTAAGQDSMFWPVFVVRALLTPFAHPLFTLWIGLAVGRQVVNGRGSAPIIGLGYLAAIATHAAWNGSLTWISQDAEQSGSAPVVLVAAIGLFVLLFIGAAIGLILMRRSERKTFDRMIPYLVDRYGLTPTERGWFFDYRAMMVARRRLPRAVRRSFDSFRAALARLAALHARGGDSELEHVYATQLRAARRDLHGKMTA